MKPRTATLALFAMGLLAAGPAQAATLTTDRGCYAEGEEMTLSGEGFTPGGFVDLSLDGTRVLTAPAGASGQVGARGPAPVIDPSRQRRFTLVATDTANPALTATARPFATALAVTVSPSSGRKTRVRKVVARGFTTGKTLYLHVRRGRYKRNLRLGKLKAPCGTMSVRKRIFTRRAPTGVYKLQFDASRKYSASRLPRVTYTTIVFRTIIRRSSARAASAPAGWLGLP